MLESNIDEGRQDIHFNSDGKVAELIPGVSITDSCVSFEQTNLLLADVYRNLEANGL